uniref:Band 4.1-like protein 4A-like n=1 Tax=Saccoglossus kowalevskii TaxID=10224 RepID=A0ABM0N182_SACKO|nr:PREDICTED: band 4.1-like protein 4A-like [Saccoglossus kowalevskii]
MSCFGDTSKEYFCCIKLLDDTELNHDIPKNIKGQVLLEKVYQHLNLIETDYFGLRYLDEASQTHWLDGTKSVAKQVKGQLYQYHNNNGTMKDENCVLIMCNGRINTTLENSLFLLWPRITKVHFKHTQFILRVIGRENTENEYYFELASKLACRHLWRCCVEQHAFFRLPHITGQSAFSSSKFRHSGRTQKEAIEASTQVKRSPPKVSRLPSKRYMRRASAQMDSSGQPILTPWAPYQDNLMVENGVTKSVAPEPVKSGAKMTPQKKKEHIPDSSTSRSTKSVPWEESKPAHCRKCHSVSDTESDHHVRRRRRRSGSRSAASSGSDSDQSRSSHKGRRRRRRRSEDRMVESEDQWRLVQRRQEHLDALNNPQHSAIIKDLRNGSVMQYL